jgi:uncharacterized protein (TIRG00374 family)
MKARLRKTLILAAKLLVAGGLLYYVLGKVHWWDYAVTAPGAEVRILATRTGPAGLTELQVKSVAKGQFQWLKLDGFRPVALRTADGQEAIVRQCRPSWTSPAEYLVQLPDGRTRWLGAGSFAPGSARVLRRGFLTTIHSAESVLLAGAFLCFLAPMLILSVRWWYLLRIQRIRIPLWEAVRLTFLGQVFNYVVPGTVSGDLVKAYYVSKHTDRKAAVLVSVFVDRVVGLLMFAILPALVIAATCAAVGWNDRLATPAIVVAVVLAGVGGSLALLLSPALRRGLRLPRIISRLPLQRHIAVVGQAANLYRRRSMGLAKACGLTFVGQAFFFTAILLAGRSLSLPVPWHQYFLYVPLIYIIAAVPISPGGLGLAETFYVAFLTPAGAAASEALALAVVARLIPMILSLPGIVVAVRGPRLPAAEQMQVELEIRPAD